MPGMTTPVKYRGIKVSPETHQAIHDLADRLDTSADGAIRHLFNKGTVRLDLSETQRERWQTLADAAGVSLAQWVALKCEASTQQATATIGLILDHVRALTDHAGVRVRPAGRRPNADRHQED